MWQYVHVVNSGESDQLMSKESAENANTKRKRGTQGYALALQGGAQALNPRKRTSYTTQESMLVIE